VSERSSPAETAAHGPTLDRNVPTVERLSSVGDPLHLLRAVFGYDSFRGEQEAIIEHVVAGGDALVLMPTGGGKSLCYQIPALCRPGVAVVVSPLIALMRDQVEALRQLGVRAAELNSSLGAAEARGVERAVEAGELDLVYVAPERLGTDRFLDLLGRTRLALFAIDEAHCVSQWGHDFRPEYLQLSLLGERFPGIPRIGLTATADEATRRDILQRLELDGARVFVSGFDRPNIRYLVVPKTSARQQLLSFLNASHPRDAGIVYCLSRRKVDETAAWLAQQGRVALPYHAGLDGAVRQANQDRFLREDGVVVVATVAFGMGIDKPDVRFVAHLDLPKSLEAYYQETGRGGRDGLPADAWMAYGFEDVVALRQLMESSDAEERFKRIERHKLDAMLGYCETTGCRRQVLLGYFGEVLPDPCGNCDTCLEPPETWDGTEAARKALSCAYRTGQRFGAGHLADVLMGHATERVQRFGHDRLSTFGIGAELSKPEWFSVFRQLVAGGFLTVDVEGYGSLHLSPQCRPLLRGERSISFRKDPRGRSKLKKAAREQRVLPDEPDAQALWDALRERRLELAREQGVPPYVIFHDSTLLEMVRQRPRGLNAMGRLPGVGDRKLRLYGQDFLDVLDRHSASWE
jgi:ATP-dependent DNA helicase RecQ